MHADRAAGFAVRCDQYRIYDMMNIINMVNSYLSVFVTFFDWSISPRK